ncbi:hypothetical protein GCM10011506_09350 [Marivirga lumbricoides]|uniref:Protein-glutamate O-methyltransferase n=1 Tax=Marivirga lumbricoides TaxID=1046115 RepID=A0ABQ1LNT9_9BACT|nr:hypothetical protein GCM10011506_09350 [Marivirga lumbricoides]
MTAQNENAEELDDLYIVGVGTSAGGLDALAKLLGSFNGHLKNLAVVVVQHLSPSFKSELAAILSRSCKWPVVTAEDGMKIQPHQVYVTPQNKRILLSKEHHLKLTELSTEYAHSPSIDEFFTSLAENEDLHAIGIVLSGSGSDGSEGIRQIKKYGGFTIAQTPASAQYKDMPHAAIETGIIDLVLHPAKIFEEISYYIKNHRLIKETQTSKDSVDVIFELLSKRTGIDFSQYKPNTIMRRMEKRMEILDVNGIAEYYQYIRKAPAELDLLFDTVLIGVTEFFRDEQAFEELGAQLKKQLEQKHFSDTIRVWCVGCATGQEPYSIAILINEILGDTISNYHLQIFATDIDERALNFARKGLYPEKEVKKLPEDILEKYFENTVEGFEVKKVVKQYILFSRHDITNDPPFVKLDLIVCRNLLIYFSNYLQKEVLRLFNYALKQDSMLFLGKSESVSVTPELFEKTDDEKLFRKVQHTAPLNLRFSRNKLRLRMEEQKKSDSKNISIVDMVKETMYYSNNNPFVVINNQGDIKEAQGSLRLYMDIGKGGATNNVMQAANKEFTVEIRSLLNQVSKSGESHTSRVIKFHLFDTDRFVKLRITPVIYPTINSQLYLLMFENVEPDAGFMQFSKELNQRNFEDYRIKELEEEVKMLREHLQTFTEELENTNEEMQAINEELQSANEELKSTNEELETSNEELQSANEELNTSNQELRFSNNSLIEKEEELKKERQVSDENAILYKTIAENLPNGTVGILNDRLEIEYVAGQGMQLLNFKLKDVVGKKLPELNPSEAERNKLNKVFKETLSGTSSSIEFSFNERTYSLKTVPLDFESSNRTGIMFLTQDITEKIQNEILIRQNEEKFRTLADNIPTLCWMANADGWIYWYNSRWYEYTGTTAEQMEGWGWQSVHDPDFLPLVMEKWEESIQQGKFFEMTFPLKGYDGKFRPFLTRIFPVKDDDGNVLQWLGTNTDISKHQLESEKLEKLVISRTKELVQLNDKLEIRNNELIESKEFLQLVIDSSIEYISVVDQKLRYVMVNKALRKVLGASEQSVIGKSMIELYPEIVDSASHKAMLKALEGEVSHIEKHLSYYGPGLFVDSYFIPFGSKENPEGIVMMSRDVTHINRVEMELERKNNELNRSNVNLEQFAFVASHDLKEPVRKIKTFASIIMSQNEMPTQKMMRYIEKIHSSSGRMLDMVDGLLTYSSLDKITGKMEEVNLEAIMMDILSDLELLINEKDAEITYDSLPDVDGIQDMLYQLFLNLIKNSLKFSREDEIPIVQVNSRVFNEDGKDFIEVKVKDNGIGFDQEDADKIFGRFVRLHSKSKYEGSGLGLSICERIVDYHKGKIAVKSQLNEGAEFSVILPKKQAKEDDN